MIAIAGGEKRVYLIPSYRERCIPRIAVNPGGNQRERGASAAERHSKLHRIAITGAQQLFLTGITALPNRAGGVNHVSGGQCEAWCRYRATGENRGKSVTGLLHIPSSRRTENRAREHRKLGQQRIPKRKIKRQIQQKRQADARQRTNRVRLGGRRTAGA